MSVIMDINEKREQDRRNRMYLAERVDKRVLSILKKKFGTEKACFLPGANGYDPLDAMRRDAYREVVNWLENAVREGKKELNQDQ